MIDSKKDRKTVFLRTFGCQMNMADAELAQGILMQAMPAITFVDDIHDANVVILNTCSVRGHAEERVFGTLRALAKRAKKKGLEPPVVGIIGCMAVEYKEKFFDMFPIVRFVCSNKDIDRLPAMIDAACCEEKQTAITEKGYGPYGSHEAERTDRIRALVPIMQGCDNYCSYCIVPYVRGREISRPPQDILDEVTRLRDQGYKQVMFLGQNVNSYGKGLSEKTSFVDFLEKAAAIDGIELLEFMTSHPKDMSDGLIDVIAAHKNISSHVHLPVQSGSDRILRMMNRGYTREQYLNLVRRMQARVPDCSITTDIIVGFPTETDKDFEETRDIMQAVPFDHAFIFKYSPREGTRADQYADDIPPEAKDRRNQELLALQGVLTKQQNEKLVGKQMRALIIQESRKNADELMAMTGNDKRVVFPKGTHQLGELVCVVLESFSANTFRGKVVV